MVAGDLWWYCCFGFVWMDEGCRGGFDWLFLLLSWVVVAGDDRGVFCLTGSVGDGV